MGAETASCPVALGLGQLLRKGDSDLTSQLPYTRFWYLNQRDTDVTIGFAREDVLLTAVTIIADELVLDKKHFSVRDRNLDHRHVLGLLNEVGHIDVTPEGQAIVLVRHCVPYVVRTGQ